MRKIAARLLALSLGVALGACHGGRPNMAPRPEALGFPLMEESALMFEGTANSPVVVRYGVAYFTTEEGSLYSLDVLSRRILWRFSADRPVSESPELCADTILIRDEGNTIYVLDTDGRVTLKTTPSDPVTTAVREFEGRIYFGCANGRITALDARANGQALWLFDAGSAVRCGPVFSDGLVVFGTKNGRLLAMDPAGKLVWTYAATGPIQVDPSASAGHVYFGTADRNLYCLASATGKKKWAFRPAGAVLHPPVAAGKRLIIAASNSVIYCLSSGSGDILWWQAVASRVVHGPSVADGVVLVSSTSPEIFGCDLRGGYRVGSYQAGGDLQAGAVWVSPYLVLIGKDTASAGGRVIFLKRDRRPVQALGETKPVRR
ncbi:MAG: PQQ-binding-like beta-propeller repeat protein [Candidatus Aminicenantales bacterium]